LSQFEGHTICLVVLFILAWPEPFAKVLLDLGLFLILVYIRLVL
jgi:hypothetical protein